MVPGDKEKWDNIYRSGDKTINQPALVLSQNQHLLPASGTALDAACGKGANAIFLARHGLTTHAWDISEAAIGQLDSSLAEEKLAINTAQRDIVSNPPDPDTYDVIVVSRFLDRNLCDALIKALRKDGLIFYQTFIKDRCDDHGPKNPDYRLDDNELLHLFSSLRIVYYREEGTIGDKNRGFRNEAMLIARK